MHECIFLHHLRSLQQRTTTLWSSKLGQQIGSFFDVKYKIFSYLNLKMNAYKNAEEKFANISISESSLMKGERGI